MFVLYQAQEYKEVEMGEKYVGPERREYPRTDGRFIISYRIKEISDDYDLTQTKNVSKGGILITTNRFFGTGVVLKMTIRFPFVQQKIEATGEVVKCKEVIRNIIYETSIKFLDLDMAVFEKIGAYINKLLTKR